MLTIKEKKAMGARVGVLVFSYIMGMLIGEVGERVITKYILEEEK